VPGRLPEDVYAAAPARWARAAAGGAGAYPGERPGRQPVHTVYVPASQYRTRLVADWGKQAMRVFVEHEDLLGADAGVYERVRAKLLTEPIEDLRIDFEDGYGRVPDDVEDAAALAAGQTLATTGGTPFVGIRFKSFEAATRRRGIRTLDLFLTGLLDNGPLPPGFVVTLPKVTAVDQVSVAAEVLARLESAYGLPEKTLRFEVQIETAQSIVDVDGTLSVARIVHAADGRCSGLHYGTYDYSAGLGIAAAYQSMEHPAADLAKGLMQVSAAGTGVRLSDGSTNRLPIGDALPSAWAEHLRLVRRSLERGFYQGWDLHPHQLPTRFAATYTFYRSGFAAAVERLRAYAEKTAGGVLDEPATAQALAVYLLRGLDCGALDEAELPFGRPELEKYALRLA
jgi:citrate lyase beta subunit